MPGSDPDAGTLFVYGTLREAGAREAVLPGFRKRTDARFPTIEPCEGAAVEGQLIEVDDFAMKDRYEGRRARPADSLYWRLPMSDGTQVYIGNPTVAARAWGTAWDVDYDREAVERELADAEPERTA